MAAAQRQAGNARGGDDAERHGLAECVGGVVDIAGDAAGADSHRSLRRIDSDAFHHRQVDDQTVIDAAQAGPAMAAAAHGNRKLVVAAEIHRRHHVGRVGTARDDERPLVDHAVIELARLLIVRVVAADDGAAMVLGEFGDGIVVHELPSQSNHVMGQ